LTSETKNKAEYNKYTWYKTH